MCIYVWFVHIGTVYKETEILHYSHGVGFTAAYNKPGNLNAEISF